MHLHHYSHLYTMGHLKHAFLIFGTIWLLITSCNSNKPAVGHADHLTRWQQVDSLNKLGQFRSAQELVSLIRQQSAEKGAWKEEFKAWMYASDQAIQNGEELPDILDSLKRRTSNAVFPLNQLLHSVVAECYWKYYQNNRWQILNRTNTEGTPTDMRTWGQQKFIDATSQHYSLSLTERDQQVLFKSSDLEELLTEGNTIQHPTLYDILAQRALRFYMNTESRLTEPAWRFTLNAKSDFDLYEYFALKKISHRDSTSLTLQAMNLFKDLTHIHIKDDEESALVALDLQRLEFVKDNSVHPKRDSLYLQALETIRSRVEEHPGYADIAHELAQWHNSASTKYQRLGTDAYKWERKKALSICKEAISKFPHSVGGKNCLVLEHQLLSSELRFNLESAILPHEAFPISLTYRNVNKAHFHLLKLKNKLDSDPHFKQEDIKRFTDRSPERIWSIDLENDGDLNTHVVELPVDPLPPGRYLLIASDSSRFEVEKDLVVHTVFHVTDIGIACRSAGNNALEVNVISRKTGKPLNGVSIEQYLRKDKKLFDGYELAQTVESKGHESVLITKENTHYRQGERYKFTLGDDIYFTNLSVYPHQQQEQEQQQTHFLLDRAIYRPGQEIHFKGIRIRGKKNDHQVMADVSSTVELYDANGQKVAEQLVRTDAFGTFSGTFNAPLGLLTGSMRIQDRHGRAHFRVEEYKRPRFEVVMNPIEGEPRLGEQVKATGKAMSYSGVPLDGSTVQWKVTRSARRPWGCWGFYRWGLPWGNDTEVASGLAETDKNGGFTVEFLGAPDHAFPKDASPLFNYSIEASVTDINGETQSGTTNLTLAYQSIQIELNLPDVLWKKQLETFDIDVKNLNGQHVDRDVDIRVVRLKSPQNPFKTRQWERPDRFVINESEFKSKLPLSIYKEENDPNNWPIERTYIDQKNWRTTSKGYVIKNPTEWLPGKYLITLSTKDSKGETIKAHKPFTILEAKNSSAIATDLFRIERIKTNVEPGEDSRLLISSLLPSTHALIEVERLGQITERKWIELKKEQRILNFKTTEADRGGYTIHLTNFVAGEKQVKSIPITVPWNNKDLHFEWMSFRDKLLPGTEEEWRVKIIGNKGNAASAQLAATMYDASLEQFVPHHFELGLWTNNRPLYQYTQIIPFGTSGSRMVWRNMPRPTGAQHTPSQLNTFGFNGYNDRVFFNASNGAKRSRGDLRLSSNIIVQEELELAVGNQVLASASDEQKASTTEKPKGAPTIRRDFRETAFFFPDLLTDKNGNTVLRFKTPEALTRWKILGLAHTKALEIGQFTKEVVTQKPLMVTPNLPRFFREQDHITVTAKISALEKRMEGTVSLELFDPFTNKTVDHAFAHSGADQTFVCAPGESAVVKWPLNIPYGIDAVGVRIVARSKSNAKNTVADGEEHILPILTDRILVTESMPLPVKGKGTHEFGFEKLLHSASSKTLKHKALTLEYTPNPAWYAVQALPYLMEFPHECAEQTFSRYYANALATHITDQKPAIKSVFAQWKKSDSDALLSNLEKNQELKNVLLEETPWLLDAQNETEQKKRISMLFDMKRMANEAHKAIKKLKELQNAQGGWSWFPGMNSSRGVTQHILAGMGHLEKLGAIKFTGAETERAMVNNAVDWLDSDVVKNFEKKKRHNANWKDYKPTYSDIQYLYARSFFPQRPYSSKVKPVVNFYVERITQEWLRYGLQEQGMIALVLHRNKDEITPPLILKSLKERATIDEELGMYWKTFKPGYRWSDLPTETHARLIECFNEVSQDKEAVKGLRMFLLKLKQTTNWKTTKATADACYALLLGGSDQLEPMPLPTIKLGDIVLKNKTKKLQAEAGTGYIKHTWQGDAVNPNMGQIRVHSSSDRVSWGAVHWQYLEQMDQVSSHETPFNIRKEIMFKRPSDSGDVLEAVGNVNDIKPGDRLTIRIELRTGRHLDHVHMKDLRGSGLEPIERLSGYKYQGGLGYYQSIKDAGIHFFFDRISPGTYVFEYDLRVTHAGDFSSGITTAMCMYAPEFNTHSAGERVNVVEQ